MTRDALLHSFLSSAIVRGIEYIAPADVRTITERFLLALERLGESPFELTPRAIRAALRQTLPPLYPPADPLGQRTIDVLRTFLAFRAPGREPEAVRALVVALEDEAEPFRTRVREGGAT